MAATLEDALDQLNITDADNWDELQLYVDAANEWVGRRLGRPGWVGDDQVPTVKLATLFLIDHLWESQRGPAATPLDGGEFVTVASRAFAVPNRVVDLLTDPASKPGPSGSFPDAVAWPDPVEWPAS